MLEDLAQMLKDNFPILKAANELSLTFPGRAAEAALRMKQMLNRGGDISEAMRPYFYPQVCDSVRAGSRSGNLAEALENVAKLVRNQGAAINKAIGALVYPGAVFIAASIAIVVMSTQVLPELEQLVPRQKWTPLGHFVFSSGQFIKSFWFVILIVIAGTVSLLSWSLPNYTGDFRATLDRFPPWSLYRRFQAAMLLQTLSLQMKANVGIKEALGLTLTRASPYLAWHVQRMVNQLSTPSTGGALAALDTGMIPAMDIRRIKLRAEGSDIEAALHKSGERSAAHVTKVIDVAGTVFGYTIIGIAAGMAALLGLGLFETLGAAAF